MKIYLHCGLETNTIISTNKWYNQPLENNLRGMDLETGMNVWHALLMVDQNLTARIPVLKAQNCQ